VALTGLDFPGLKAKMQVVEGDHVHLGQALFSYKHDPAVQFTSPGTGTVIAINRGARRTLETVVIQLDDREPDEPAFDALTDDALRTIDRSSVTHRLLQSGAWTSFRTRPYSHVPDSDAIPRSIFVTAHDTQPLAGDPGLVIQQNLETFNTGLIVMSRLTGGRVFLCVGKDWTIKTAAVDRLETVQFSGPHPAGLPGTHIHFLDPVSADRTVWHIDYQDVIAIGRLFSSGCIHTARVVALGGDLFTRPRLVETRLGASIEDLLVDEFDSELSCRVISGSPLSGRTASGSNAYLGRYHNQVSLLSEIRERKLFGWLGALSRRYTASSTFLKKTGHRRKYSFTTARNGRYSAMLPVRVFDNAMLPVRVFDKVIPMDILPSSLFRALMVMDTEQAQALGCLELDEEDLALCSFVCPAKQDYGAILRQNLEQIEKEG
jgi:Na+-transporting NADH:ubiquinone oxidoreductase subunit A